MSCIIFFKEFSRRRFLLYSSNQILKKLQNTIFFSLLFSSVFFSFFFRLSSILSFSSLSLLFSAPFFFSFSSLLCSLLVCYIPIIPFHSNIYEYAYQCSSTEKLKYQGKSTKKVTILLTHEAVCDSNELSNLARADFF